ncbi:hypothetical protein NKH99_25450 [Mesorhizobium sp. M0854]|uniref:hypothetical protein n=1 Tax=Mesorhizobium sp. M0854 TaxID=2957013 RepID=UPI0033357A91
MASELRRDLVNADQQSFVIRGVKRAIPPYQVIEREVRMLRLVSAASIVLVSTMAQATGFICEFTKDSKRPIGSKPCYMDTDSGKRHNCEYAYPNDGKNPNVPTNLVGFCLLSGDSKKIWISCGFSNFYKPVVAEKLSKTLPGSKPIIDPSWGILSVGWSTSVFHDDFDQYFTTGVNEPIFEVFCSVAD